LYGRETLLAHLQAAIDGWRLVTLIGGPGIGKSRLAQEVAHHRRLADHDVLLVRPGPSLLSALWISVGSPTLGAAVGVTPGPRREALLEALVAEVERRAPALLIVDGPEDVTPDQATELLELLSATVRLRTLVVSRSPLGVSGEQVVEVGPLALDAAVELLTARVGSTVPVEPATLESLAARVEGIPLALELAAALVQTLGTDAASDLLGRSLGALAVAETTARPGLTAAVHRSWQSLTPAERSELVALVPFVGGFTLDQATAILGDAGVQALAKLRTRSLVHLRAAGRFAVFDTIREFVARIAPPEELAAARLRHARWFAGAVGAGSPAEVVVELPNAQPALDALVDAGLADEACALLDRMATLPLPTDDHLRWAARGVALATTPDARAGFEAASANLLRRAGRTGEALHAAHRAVALAADPEHRFVALHNQVEAAVALGDDDEAEAAARTLLDLCPHLPTCRGVVARLALGRVLVRRDPGAAIHLVDSLQGSFSAEDDQTWAYGESIRGFALMRIDPDRAEEHLAWLDDWHHEHGLGDRATGIRAARIHLLVRGGRAREAEQLQQAHQLHRGAAPFDGLIRGWIAWLDGDLRRCREELEGTASMAEAARDPLTEGLALAALGQLARRIGRTAQAEALLRRAAGRHVGHRAEILAWLAAAVAEVDPARAERLLVGLDPGLLGVRCARRVLSGPSGPPPALPAEHELVDRIGVDVTGREVEGGA
ncbi:MAG: hypothetical protein ABMB14_27285, partial [Myxococcota bacterium]